MLQIITSNFYCDHGKRIEEPLIEKLLVVIVVVAVVGAKKFPKVLFVEFRGSDR